MRFATTVAGLALGTLLAGCAQNGGGAVQNPAGEATGAGQAAPVTTEPVPAGLSTTSTADSTAGRQRSDRFAQDAARKLKEAAQRLETRARNPRSTFRVPKLVGLNLQTAQDRLQALDSFVLDQRDATGQGRLQLIDSRWRVCRQSPRAGARVPITRIVVLSSVRLDESCP
jgi:hypothetical protein